MKPQSSAFNLAFIAIILVIVLASFIPGDRVQAMPPYQSAAETNACEASRTINVSGTAILNVPPDRALIQLGVESTGRTPSEVEAANAASIQRVIKALGALGIASKDIVTDRYIITPVYESYDSLYIKGYRIDNIVAVTLRDVEKVSQVIVEALESDANQVINVELYTSELRAYRDQAREMAMVAAQEKAEALAAAAQADTGCVLHISENTWSYYNGWWNRSNRDLWTQNVVQNAPTNGTGVYDNQDGPVSLGQISIRAEVSATYELK
jgi:hypothetical protein